MAKIDPDNVDALLQRLWSEELQKCAEDAEYWIFDSGCVHTKDEHDPDTAVKPFPDKAYLRLLLRQWLDGEDIQFVVKSRQVMVSWLMTALSVWTAKFQPHALVLFQSKKFEDAAKMVYFKYPNTARCSFIENNLPDWQKVCLTSDNKWIPVDISSAGAEGALTYPNGSRIEAIPDGPAQVEGRVPTRFFGDESSLCPEWRAGFSAALPCLVGGTKHKGRGVWVSTMRMPSDFSDECEMAGSIDPDQLIPGVSEFRSKSGVQTTRVHYTADPEKNPGTDAQGGTPEGREWIIAAASGYRGGIASPEWQTHMEINPQTLSGERVIPYWNKIKAQVVIDPIPEEVYSTWKLDSGLDYGSRNPTVWLIFANDYEGNRYLVHEISIPGNEIGGIAGFCRIMQEHPLFTRLNGRIHADPSIWNRDQNLNGGLCSKAQIFQDNGVFLTPAKTKGQEADDILIERLHGYYWSDNDSDDFEPKLKVFNTCRKTIAAIPMWLYQDWQESLKDTRSLKQKMVDNWVDEFDAWKYTEVAIPQPAYAKAQAPIGSFNYLRNLVRKQSRQNSNLRS